MQRRAVQFVEDVLGDPDKATEIEALTPEEYAERKRISISPNPNQQGKRTMAGPTKQELQTLVDDVGIKLTEILNPALSREEIVIQLQELDELVNGTD
jgi:hypothetical protein